jgi:hypothetical protein
MDITFPANHLPLQVNPEYLAVNWESGGGGAFAVIPLNERGKLPDQIPLFRGHTAAVLDTDWCALHQQARFCPFAETDRDAQESF